MKLYVLYDKTAEDGVLFTAVNDGIAWRNYNTAISQSPYPDEYDLYCLGEFDPKTMSIQSLTPPKLMRYLSELETNNG